MVHEDAYISEDHNERRTDRWRAKQGRYKPVGVTKKRSVLVVLPPAALFRTALCTSWIGISRNARNFIGYISTLSSTQEIFAASLSSSSSSSSRKRPSDLLRRQDKSSIRLVFRTVCTSVTYLLIPCLWESTVPHTQRVFTPISFPMFYFTTEMVYVLFCSDIGIAFDSLLNRFLRN
jgi:hypothetical protein